MDVYARARPRIIAVTLTRPADTVQYTPGDVVCNSTDTPTPLVFSSASLDPIVRCATIISASIACSANLAMKPDVELWLFTVPPAMDADNAPFTPTDAELEHLVCVLDFAAAAFGVGHHVGDATVGNLGNVVLFRSAGTTIPFQCAPEETSLYGVLVARNAYVPLAGESFRVALGVVD